MALPPSAPAVHARVTLASPGVAERPVGAEGALVTDVRVKVRVAIGSAENLPLPTRLAMNSGGSVSSLSSENPVPSSVPASNGCRVTVRDGRQPPRLSSIDSPETPTNQSGLGATIVNRVTRGWSVVSATPVKLSEAVGPMEPVVPSRTLRWSAPAAWISPFSRVVPPSSAIDSTPGLACLSSVTKTTSPLWTPPTSREKCAPAGTPSGVAAVVQSPSNVTVYSAREKTAAGSGGLGVSDRSRGTSPSSGSPNTLEGTESVEPIAFTARNSNW